MNERTIVVGTRKSHLAVTQSNQVIALLKETDPQLSFELEKIVTKGDRILNVTLSKVGGKGLFVKEIERALLEKQIDMAIHSMKDLPSEEPEGLIVGAIPIRIDPRDCLLSREGMTLEELPSGSVVGTSSLRRQAQVLALRPDLQVEPVRGNVETRIHKMRSGDFDAIILAAAGIDRLGLQEEVTEYLSTSQMLPAVGQGALAVQCRSDDLQLREWLQSIHNEGTAAAVLAERAFLKKLEAGCHLPVAGYAESLNGTIRLTGLVAQPDGKMMMKETRVGSDGEKLGQDLATLLLEQGADKLLSMV